MSKIRFVLDAWAVIAFLQAEEPANSRVKELLADADTGTTETCISVINLGEVFYTIAKRQGNSVARTAIAGVHKLPISVIDAAEERVFAAAEVKSKYPISYADAFAVAAAVEKQAVLATGDPEIIRWCRSIISIEPLQRARK